MGFIQTTTEIGDSLLEGSLLQLKVTKWILRFLLELVTKQSAWTYNTSAGFTVSGGVAKFVSYTPVRDNIWLHRGRQRMRLEFCAPLGAGVGLSAPWQIVSVTATTKEFHSTGYVGIPPFVPDFEQAKDFEGTGIIFNIDTNVLLVGKSISILMLGVNPWVPRLLQQIAEHHREMVALVQQKPPENFVPRVLHSTVQSARITAKLGQIAIEIQTLLFILGTNLKFRGIIFMEGFEASVCAHPPWVTLAVGISVAIGWVEATEENALVE